MPAFLQMAMPARAESAPIRHFTRVCPVHINALHARVMTAVVQGTCVAAGEGDAVDQRVRGQVVPDLAALACEHTSATHENPQSHCRIAHTDHGAQDSPAHL